MKHYLLNLVAALMVAVVMNSCASVPRSYEDLDEINGVSMVYMGPTMLKMAGSLSNIAGVPNLQKLSKHITSFRYITVNNNSAIKRVRPFVKREVKMMGAQPMFNTLRGNGEHVSLYTTPSTSDPSKFTNLILVTDIGHNMNVMTIGGLFSSEDVNDLVE